jgi:hypothetical protein
VLLVVTTFCLYIMTTDEIDRNIIKALSEYEILSSQDLKDKIESKDYLNRTLSPDTYSSHMKNLVAEKVLEKNFENPRHGLKWIFYSLTESAKEEYLFQILEIKSKTKNKKIDLKKESDEEKRQKMYHLLFFLETQDHPVYELHTDQQLEDFLSKVNVAKNELKVEGEEIRAAFTTSWAPYRRLIPIDETLNVEPITSITPPYRVFITRYKLPNSYVRIWEERYAYYDYAGETAVRKELEGLKKKIEGLRDSNVSISLWRYAVPGISMSDLLNYKRYLFKHIYFTWDEAQRAFDLLKQKEIIKPVCVFFDEIRYSITDQALREVIIDCWNVFGTIEEIMMLTWLYLRKPKDREIKHATAFYGYKTTLKNI